MGLGGAITWLSPVLIQQGCCKVSSAEAGKWGEGQCWHLPSLPLQDPSMKGSRSPLSKAHPCSVIQDPAGQCQSPSLHLRSLSFQRAGGRKGGFFVNQ